jgi:hypothetical protein
VIQAVIPFFENDFENHLQLIVYSGWQMDYLGDVKSKNTIEVLF